MTLDCTPTVERGTMTLSGTVPNGAALLTRTSPGMSTTTVRGGSFDISTGGFDLDDVEAPFGVPLTYRLDVAITDRLIQHNLLPTPTFLHGVQGWSTGTGRTLAIEADSSAHSSNVGHFSGNSSGAVPLAPPVLIGHVNGPPLVSGPYTLTPTTAGATAIATGDNVYLIHQQLSTVAQPAIPAGFTLLTSFFPIPGSPGGDLPITVWQRTRAAGDSSYTVSSLTGAASIGTLLWVRNASTTYLPLVSQFPLKENGNTLAALYLTAPRPALVLSIMSAQTVAAGAQPTSASVDGATWQYTVASGTDPRSVTVSSYDMANAGITPTSRVTYSNTLAQGLGFQLALQSNMPSDPRIIARGKTTLIPAAADPYLFTGRFRYTTTDLWNWQDVLNQGTWQHLKDTKATWADVLSSNAGTADDYARLFVAIIDPVSGSYYVNPVQVLTATAANQNTWQDFSFFFPVLVDIPATAEIRLLHGTNLREYAIQWYLDEFGVTPGADRKHNTLYWFDGDTAVPANAEDYLLLGGNWDSTSADATISWTGTIGNSASIFTAPSAVYTTTVCQFDDPGGDLCTPIYLNDPISPRAGQWYSLLHIDALSYAARQTIMDVINRADQVAVSAVRAWASGSLVLLTRTLDERALALASLATGNILLLRNPDPAYPETSWYLAIGNVTESRLSEDLRRPERLWTVPFIRVERPSGLIDSYLGVSWQNVLDDYANWLAVRDRNTDWLQLMTVRAGAL
jgi:hypothetical protein